MGQDDGHESTSRNDRVSGAEGAAEGANGWVDVSAAGVAVYTAAESADGAVATGTDSGAGAGIGMEIGATARSVDTARGVDTDEECGENGGWSTNGVGDQASIGDGSARRRRRTTERLRREPTAGLEPGPGPELGL